LTREQRRLAAIAAIDVVGFARLMGHDESGTLARLKTHRSEQLAPAIARNNGRLVKTTGDGALVEFPSAVDAVRAMIEFQQGLAHLNRNHQEPNRVVYRAGVHLGDLIVEDEDLYGASVNIAARLEAECPPGGILISRAVRDAIEGRLAAKLHPLGELALKNIDRPVRAFRVDWNAADWQTPASGAPKSTAARVAAAVVPPDKPSIAVLPFQNMSGDAEQEYFVDGLVDDIVTSLSRISLFFVIARNSSFAYKGRVVDVRQVGRELGVRYVLEGSVRKAGNRLRITGQLVDTSSGNHLWADRFDGSMEDVFELQDKITSSVVAVIEPKVQRAEVKRAQAKPTESLGAYDLYLRALAVVDETSEQSVTRALDLLGRALEIDPAFSAAHGLVANCHWYRLAQSWGSPVEAQSRGLEAARRAIEFGKEDPVALARGGLGIAYLGGRPKEGIAHIERALALNPNSLLARRYGGWVYWFNGDHERSIENFARSMELSPMDPGAYDAYAGIAFPYFFTRRFEESLAWTEKALRERPQNAPALWLRVALLAMMDRPKEDVEEAVRRLRVIEPGASLASIHRRAGAIRKADIELVEEALLKAGLPQ
jgi:adenylate cyclase